MSRAAREVERSSSKPSGERHGARARLRFRMGGAVVLLVLLSGTITACGTDDEPSSTDSDADLPVVDAAPGGDAPIDNVNWAGTEAPADLDPALGTGYAAEIRSNLCESLIRYNADGSTEPALAESVENPDPKTFIYNLRPGVEFWDGQEVTAEDVAFSLNRHLDPELASHFSPYFENVDSMEASGPRQVTITMKRPDYLFASELGTFAGSVVQKEYAEQAGKEFGTRSGGLMCTGPYEVKSWDATTIVLEANRDYWDEDLQPKASTLTFRVLPNEGTITSGLLAEELDGAALYGATAPARLQGEGPGTLYLGSATFDMQLMGTTRPGPLQDLEVREALSLALPRTGVADTVYSGIAAPAKSIISAIQPWSYAVDQFEDYFADRAPMSTSGDIEEATEMVQAAGAEGAEINIASSGEYKEITDIVVETANSIGLDARATTLTTNEGLALYYDQKVREQYDGFVLPWNTNVPDPLENLVYFKPDGIYNYSGYDNPEYTKLVDQALGTEDSDERAGLVLEALTILDGDLPWIPIVDLPQVVYMNDRIGGAPVSLPGRYWSPWGALIGGN